MSKTQNTGPMLEIHRKALRSCRVHIVRDLDVNEIVDQLIQDDILTLSMSNDIMSKPIKEDRAKFLLDKLETRGNAAFQLFLLALKSTHRHLAVYLENKVIELIQQDKEDEYENAYISGVRMQSFLKKNLSRDDDMSEFTDIEENDADEDDYLDCYDVIRTVGNKAFGSGTSGVPTGPRGFIKKTTTQSNYREVNFTGLLKSTTCFKEIPWESIPKVIQRPPHYCKVFVQYSMPKIKSVKKVDFENMSPNLEILNRSVDQVYENQNMPESNGMDDADRNHPTDEGGSKKDTADHDGHAENDLENEDKEGEESQKVTTEPEITTDLQQDPKNTEPLNEDTETKTENNSEFANTIERNDQSKPDDEKLSDANVKSDDGTSDAKSDDQTSVTDEDMDSKIYEEPVDVIHLEKNEIIIVDKTEIDIGFTADELYMKCFHDTFIAYDRYNRAFYIPAMEIKRYGDPEGEPWFYPVELSSRQATLMLSQTKQDGCFLVYRSTNKESGAMCTLSLSRESGEVFHYHIKEETDQTVRLQNHEKVFLTIDELIKYFQQNKDKLSTRLRRPLCEAGLPVTPGKQYHIKWELDRFNLTFISELGKGNFGIVWMGRYFKDIVAIKALQKCDPTASEQDDFLDEAKVLMALQHEHILRFIGLSCREAPFYVITEFVKNGSLRQCLKNGLVKKDDIDGLFDMCIQITSGMKYLESKKFVLHRDLAARNCLLDENCTVKIGDFGMSRWVMDDAYQAPKSEKIPIKWAAPEVLKESFYTTKSDVWSTGVVFWEIFSSGQRPMSGIAGEMAAAKIVEGYQHPQPKLCPPEMYRVMRLCWKMNPAERPSFSVLHDKLRTKSTMYYATRDLRKEFLRCNLGETHAWQRQRSVSIVGDEVSNRGDTLQLNFEYRHEMPEEQENKTQDLLSTADTESLREFDQEHDPSFQAVLSKSKSSLFRRKKKKEEKEKEPNSKFYVKK